MTLTRASTPWDSPDWSCEIKWDGYRALVHTDRKGVRITSRHGTNLTTWFPHLQDLRGDVDGVAVLDGELVVFDENGMPAFDMLKRGAGAVFVAFDVLKHGRRLYCGRPLFERQNHLAKIVTDSGWLLRSRPFIGMGTALYGEACVRGLEGVVLKRISSVYACGVRSKDWVKVHTPNGAAMIRERMRHVRRK